MINELKTFYRYLIPTGLLNFFYKYLIPTGLILITSTDI